MCALADVMCAKRFVFRMLRKTRGFVATARLICFSNPPVAVASLSTFVLGIHALRVQNAKQREAFLKTWVASKFAAIQDLAAFVQLGPREEALKRLVSTRPNRLFLQRPLQQWLY
jgi:hypothetical protein